MTPSIRLTMAVPALLLLGLGCSSSPTGPSNPDGVNAVVTTPNVALGADIPMVLQNRSGGAITVGPLGCTASLEHRNPSTGGWERLDFFRTCISVLYTVAEGHDLAFDVPSPDLRGRYRVLFGARTEAGELVEVRSNNFEVK